MPESLDVHWPPSDPTRLGGLFTRLGRLGVIIQLVLLAVPIVLALYLFIQTNPDAASRKGIDLGNYLSYGSLLVMLFTTYWFWRFANLGRKIQDAVDCPPQASVMSKLWIGVWASSLGIFFSMVLLFGAAWRLLFVLLATPQTGLMVAPALGDSPTQSISAFDAISLTALLIILAAELIVLGLTIWLLYRTIKPARAKAA